MKNDKRDDTLINLKFNLEDISQIVIGSFALSVPIAFSQEAWETAVTLPLGNFLLVIILTLAFLSFYTYQSIFQHDVKSRLYVFIFRIFITYFITFIVVALTLLALDKLPILTDTIVAIKRIVIIAMPASIGAIVVDGMDKE